MYKKHIKRQRGSFADARPDIPPVIVNWHHDYFLEVSILHATEIPEEMKLTKVMLFSQALHSCPALHQAMCFYIKPCQHQHVIVITVEHSDALQFAVTAQGVIPEASSMLCMPYVPTASQSHIAVPLSSPDKASGCRNDKQSQFVRCLPCCNTAGHIALSYSFTHSLGRVFFQAEVLKAASLTWRQWHGNYYHSLGESVYEAFNNACKYLHYCGGKNTSDVTPIFIERSGDEARWSDMLPAAETALKCLLPGNNYFIGDGSLQNRVGLSWAYKFGFGH